MRRLITLLPSVALLSACGVMPPSPPAAPAPAITVPDTLAELPGDDRARVAEAFQLASSVGERVWPGLRSAPFAVLLVTREREFLLRHPRPSPDFTRVGYDSLLRTEVFVRPRVFPPNLLATFPAVGEVPTIVVGQPVNTGHAGSTRWVLTLLHEHFHQWQNSQAGYYAGVDSLKLARGDSTGTWMLNYAFPYDSGPVQARFAELSSALDRALASHLDGGAARAALREVMSVRRRLAAALSSDDDRYLAFQMWQEGVSRYTELRVAREAAAMGFVSTAPFRTLRDRVSYADAADAIERDIRAALRHVDLARNRRVAFYPVGAATALLLDAAVPDWRARYLGHRFSLDPLLP